MKDVKVGLIGFGTVGSGVVKILKRNSEVIEQRLGFPIILKKVADLDITTDRGVELEKGVLTGDLDEIIEDPEISIVIELIGGFEPAKSIILQAVKHKKHVVTANKALLATHGEEIFQAAEKNRVDIAFEASVGGGIPILRSLREGLVANRIKSILGIMNGTTNFILSEMTNRGGNIEDVLEYAYKLGYAEADPSLDLEGIDIAHKLAIILTLSYGTRVKLEDIYTEGISRIIHLNVDIGFAKELGYKIKLLALCRDEGDKIEARIHPTMLPFDHLLSKVDGIFNAFYVLGDAVGVTLFYGKGAGMMPTASAVAGDLVELCRNISRGIASRTPALSYQQRAIQNKAIKDINEVITNYYLRFSAVDSPGVLSRISGILGKFDISISSVIQKDRKIKGAVPIVMMTHKAKERNIRKAIKEINELDVVLDQTVLIRVENEGLEGDCQGVEGSN